MPGRTMKENSYATPGQWQLLDDHLSAQFRWNAPNPKEDLPEGLRWNSLKVEAVKEKLSDDSLEGLRYCNPATAS